MIHVVLYHPEKPQNTGNIMRTVVATGSVLHIIGPITFTINDKTIKRTGLDYLSELKYVYYPSYEAFMDENNHPDVYCLSRYGDRLYTDIHASDSSRDYFIMFGSESSGIDGAIMKAHRSRLFRIPMVATARSLNVSNTVSLVVYECLRQQQFPNMAKQEVIKGPDFLQKKLGD
jgi:tRNA (cytidine/uridine-2'-O-)-methyltransferase